MVVETEDIIDELRRHGSRRNLEGMERFGSNAKNALGVSVPEIRKIAKKIGKSHREAGGLWSSGIKEARILASMIDNPDSVTAAQMDRWANSFDCWDVCDECCGNLFCKTEHAYKKVFEWSDAEKEFVKRTSFALMASLAVHDKVAEDEKFIRFLPLIKGAATDERNFVKKAVNWALRQIGKRNRRLNKLAIKTAEEIKMMDSRSARWIASDALRELKGRKFA